MHADYYNNVLYPIQDRAFKAFGDTSFYLTGGTTLSRGYYRHRYSDDLDYFVNYISDFDRQADLCVENLKSIFDDVEIDYKSPSFYRIFVSRRRLKIELVNDVPSHIGVKVMHPVLGLIDSKENILANKISAVIDRQMPKDFADIYFLLKDGLSIRRALTDADSKAAGIVPIYVAKILAEYDHSLLDTEIKWISPVSGEEVSRFFYEIALQIVKGTVQ